MESKIGRREELPCSSLNSPTGQADCSSAPKDGTKIHGRVAYFFNFPNFTTPPTIDHLLQLRGWTETKFRGWNFKNLLEANLSFYPLKKDSNLDPKDSFEAGFGNRPSGVPRASMVEREEIRNFSGQFLFESTASQQLTEDFQIGPRAAVGVTLNNVHQTDTPIVKQDIPSSCAPGDMFCPGTTPPPVNLPPPAATRDLKNTNGVVRIGGAWSYKPVTFFSFGGDAFFQIPLFGGGNSSLQVRPELTFTLPIVNSVALFLSLRPQAVIDLVSISKSSGGLQFFSGVSF